MRSLIKYFYVPKRHGGVKKLFRGGGTFEWASTKAESPVNDSIFNDRDEGVGVRLDQVNCLIELIISKKRG